MSITLPTLFEASRSDTGYPARVPWTIGQSHETARAVGLLRSIFSLFQAASRSFRGGVDVKNFYLESILHAECNVIQTQRAKMLVADLEPSKQNRRAM